MLIARAPMRISYAGGGTDLEAYYRQYGGMVVSCAINKYFYVIINPTGDGSLQVSSADYRAFLRYDAGTEPMGVGGELKHAEAALRLVGLTAGYSVFMASEVPSGTGLGSSSAVAVALVKGLSTLVGRRLDKAEVAEAACRIELEELGMPIGRQDQYASAFGGLNSICFDTAGVRVEPMAIALDTLRRLETSTLLFHTGLGHDSSKLLGEQKKRTEAGTGRTLEALHTIKANAIETREALLAGDTDRVGEILARSWEAKKVVNEGVSNPTIDAAYSAAREAGALGGKIAGAGAGGFLLVYCIPERQAAVTRALHALGMPRTDFRFDATGARVLMNNVAA